MAGNMCRLMLAWRHDWCLGCCLGGILERLVEHVCRADGGGANRWFELYRVIIGQRDGRWQRRDDMGAGHSQFVKPDLRIVAEDSERLAPGTLASPEAHQRLDNFIGRQGLILFWLYVRDLVAGAPSQFPPR